MGMLILGDIASPHYSQTMGRARASTSDVFATVFGTRRGIESLDITEIEEALRAGDFTSALSATDVGTLDHQPHIIDLLSLRLADAIGRSIEEEIRSKVPQTLLSQDQAENELPLFRHQEFYVLASAGVHNVLQRGRGRRRGVETLLQECELAITDEAYAECARFIRSGGYTQTGGLAFLCHCYFTDATVAPEIIKNMYAQSTYILKAIDGEWVQFLLANSQDQRACGQKLIEQAAFLRSQRNASARGRRSRQFPLVGH
jgi:hypothetical protein